MVLVRRHLGRIVLGVVVRVMLGIVLGIPVVLRFMPGEIIDFPGGVERTGRHGRLLFEPPLVQFPDLGNKATVLNNWHLPGPAGEGRIDQNDSPAPSYRRRGFPGMFRFVLLIAPCGLPGPQEQPGPPPGLPPEGDPGGDPHLSRHPGSPAGSPFRRGCGSARKKP